MLFPEFLQLDCRAEKLVRYTRDLLDVPGLRAELVQDLSGIKDQLGQGHFVTTAASYIRDILAKGQTEFATTLEPSTEHNSHLS